MNQNYENYNENSSVSIKVEEKLHEGNYNKIHAEGLFSRKIKYIKRLERDIDKLNSYIFYCNNKVKDICVDKKDFNEIEYYKRQIEKSEIIIKDKYRKIEDLTVGLKNNQYNLEYS